MKIVLCIPKDWSYHWSLGDIGYIYEYDLVSNKGCGFCINMFDSKFLKLTDRFTIQQDTYLVYNKKLFDRYYEADSYDLSTFLWLNNDLDILKIDNYENFNALLQHVNNNVYHIPVLKIEQWCREVIQNIINNNYNFEITPCMTFYKEVVSENIMTIESNGIHVDLPLFNKIFGQYPSKSTKGNLLFNEYNLYTSTGRPSNAYGGVNFVALNKQDDSRKAFTSRWGSDGVLVEYDFDSYHIRLLGRLLDIELPEENLHDFFGKMYFDCDSLTQEQHNLSKQITFKMIYSKPLPEFKHFKLFKAIEQFKDKLWQEYLQIEYIQLPISKRKIYKKTYGDMYRSKLFNYYLQGIETDFSMIFIQKVLNLLRNRQSKLVLYTYDSFLLDLTKKEKAVIVEQLNRILPNVNVKVGSNFFNLNYL